MSGNQWEGVWMYANVDTGKSMELVLVVMVKKTSLNWLSRWLVSILSPTTLDANSPAGR
jgi:hypothetical protein